MTEVYVPAYGVFATVIWHWRKDNGRPTENDVYVERQPIVAWRIDTDEDGAMPVLPDEVRSAILIECPDGKLLQPYGVTYDNLDAAKTGVLKDEQEQWDHRQKAQEHLRTKMAS